MWNPFRQPETPVEPPDRHAMTLDLIEQVTALRGQVRAMESEWDDIRSQIRKGYQRMEKAYQRLDAAGLDEAAPDEVSHPEKEPTIPLVGFAKKLQQMRGS